MCKTEEELLDLRSSSGETCIPKCQIDEIRKGRQERGVDCIPLCEDENFDLRKIQTPGEECYLPETTVKPPPRDAKELPLCPLINDPRDIPIYGVDCVPLCEILADSLDLRTSDTKCMPLCKSNNVETDLDLRKSVMEVDCVPICTNGDDSDIRDNEIPGENCVNPEDLPKLPPELPETITPNELPLCPNDDKRIDIRGRRIDARDAEPGVNCIPLCELNELDLRNSDELCKPICESEPAGPDNLDLRKTEVDCVPICTNADESEVPGLNCVIPKPNRLPLCPLEDSDFDLRKNLVPGVDCIPLCNGAEEIFDLRTSSGEACIPKCDIDDIRRGRQHRGVDCIPLCENKEIDLRQIQTPGKECYLPPTPATTTKAPVNPSELPLCPMEDVIDVRQFDFRDTPIPGEDCIPLCEDNGLDLRKSNELCRPVCEPEGNEANTVDLRKSETSEVGCVPLCTNNDETKDGADIRDFDRDEQSQVPGVNCVNPKKSKPVVKPSELPLCPIEDKLDVRNINVRDAQTPGEDCIPLCEDNGLDLRSSNGLCRPVCTNEEGADNIDVRKSEITDVGCVPICANVDDTDIQNFERGGRPQVPGVDCIKSEIIPKVSTETQDSETSVTESPTAVIPLTGLPLCKSQTDAEDESGIDVRASQIPGSDCAPICAIAIDESGIDVRTSQTPGVDCVPICSTEEYLSENVDIQCVPICSEEENIDLRASSRWGCIPETEVPREKDRKQDGTNTGNEIVDQNSFKYTYDDQRLLVEAGRGMCIINYIVM